MRDGFDLVPSSWERFRVRPSCRYAKFWRRFPQADVRSSLKKLPALDALSPGRYRLLLTLSAEQKEKLELVQRRLLERDGACCAFVSDEGVRCDARAFLQFHHRQPWARGGGDTAENLEVMCQAHNRLLAERDFGADHMDQFVAGAGVDLLRGAK